MRLSRHLEIALGESSSVEVWPKDVNLVSSRWESRPGPKRGGTSLGDEVRLFAALKVKGKKYEVNTPWLTDKDDEKTWISAIKAELSKLLRKGKSDRMLCAKSLKPANASMTKLAIR